VFWSGDVGNDWKTLRYQLAAGLNFVATGLPWWTYDAGGFFRPADQYTNADYIERMIRWIQAGTFLPLMRVHGYMSNTEPWQYGKEAQRIITNFIEFRYRLLPYIYSEAARVTSEGYTLMRPFVFDFPNDSQALEQEQEYMFGEAILVNPVTEKGVTEWSTYLPQHPAGWYDMATARWYEGGQTVTTPVSIESIPLFAKGGSIIPIGPVRQSTAEKSDKPTDIYIIPGDNATFTLYEDEGTNYNYEKGEYSTIPFNWNNDKQQLTIGKRSGGFEGMEQEKTFIIHLGKETKTIRYTGKKVNIKF
jgi:alpha-D-xyloside xylohydrolase